MKIKFLLLSFVLLSLVCYSQSDSTIQYDTLIKKGYKIKCPKSWDNFSPKTGRIDLFMMEPDETKKSNARANVNILITDLMDKKMDLDKYKTINEDDLKNHLRDFVLIKSVIMKDKNISYYEYAYTWTSSKRHLRMFARCFLKNEKVYIATFTGETETYSDYKKIADNIINSFMPL